MQGPKGEAGPQGPIGLTGPQGPAGSTTNVWSHEVHISYDGRDSKYDIWLSAIVMTGNTYTNEFTSVVDLFNQFFNEHTSYLLCTGYVIPSKTNNEVKAPIIVKMDEREESLILVYVDSASGTKNIQIDPQSTVDDHYGEI